MTDLATPAAPAAAAVSATAVPAAGSTIVVDGLSKWMGPVVALSEVSFSLGTGVHALLGPNGAGKSTLLRAMCGLTSPSQGTVRVLGADPRTNLAVRARIGLVPQQDQLFEPLSAVEHAQLAARLHGVADVAGAVAAAMAHVDLPLDDVRPLRTYSKGMRQRVKVAMALVHDPAVIFLDEPLEGLDPRQRLRMIELFSDLGASGRTVVVSSHVLDEVERFGSSVLVVAKGRLAAQGDFRLIRDLMDERPHRLRITTDQPAALGAGLLAAGTVVGAYVERVDALLIDTVTIASARQSIVQVAAAAGAHLRGVEPLDDDLDSVFRYLVGPAARGRADAGNQHRGDRMSNGGR